MKQIYILFSATPYKVGSFIRHMLHNHYNHVSISFDADLSEMYTFSRHHANMPFFAGFVKESFGRYEWKGDASDIKVCRLSVSDRRYELLRKYIKKMSERAEEYVYNYYSAAMTLLHHRIRIRDAYTCVEFVGDLLGIVNFDGVQWGGFHSLQELEKKCTPYMIYEGSSRSYPTEKLWNKEDAFCRKMPMATGIKATVTSFGTLTKRGVHDAYSFVLGKLTQAD